MKFSNKELAQEARRELGMRRHVYAERVARGQMQKAAADRLIALMDAMREHFEALAARDEPDLFAGAAQPPCARCSELEDVVRAVARDAGLLNTSNREYIVSYAVIDRVRAALTKSVVHHELCDVNDKNAEGIVKPCNCQGRTALGESA